MDCGAADGVRVVDGQDAGAGHFLDRVVARENAIRGQVVDRWRLVSVPDLAKALVTDSG